MTSDFICLIMYLKKNLFDTVLKKSSKVVKVSEISGFYGRYLGLNFFCNFSNYQEVRTVKIADRTGMVNLSLWNEPGKVLQSGSPGLFILK